MLAASLLDTADFLMTVFMRDYTFTIGGLSSVDKGFSSVSIEDGNLNDFFSTRSRKLMHYTTAAI